MIFDLFKSKPRLKELIPNGFVDIHSHILPGIDDGAKNIEESLKLINGMKKLGFAKIIATPHTYSGVYNNTKETIKESFEIIKEKLKNNFIIEYASEYMIDDSIRQKIDNKSLLTIKGNYILIEFSYISFPINVYEIIFLLVSNGYIPIIAHPERYLYLNNKFDEYKKLKDFGCKFQLNLLSVTGFYGKEVLELSDKLLNGAFIDFVGSDIHYEKQIKMFNNKIKIKNINMLELAIKSNSIFK